MSCRELTNYKLFNTIDARVCDPIRYPEGLSLWERLAYTCVSEPTRQQSYGPVTQGLRIIVEGSEWRVLDLRMGGTV